MVLQPKPEITFRTFRPIRPPNFAEAPRSDLAAADRPDLLLSIFIRSGRPSHRSDRQISRWSDDLDQPRVIGRTFSIDSASRRGRSRAHISKYQNSFISFSPPPPTIRIS